jgi:hypothetical protein
MEDNTANNVYKPKRSYSNPFTYFTNTDLITFTKPPK